MQLSSIIKDEVPAALMDAHMKNVESSSVDGKYDPSAGLAQSGIAGTTVEKESSSEDNKENDKDKENNANEKVKDKNDKSEDMEIDKPVDEKEKTEAETKDSTKNEGNI